MNSENARHAGEPSAPSLVEVLEVIRPQVEKIEEGFKAIRVTLDALAEHLGTSSIPAENRRGPAPATKEPADGRGAAAGCRAENQSRRWLRRSTCRPPPSPFPPSQPASFCPRWLSPGRRLS